MLNIPKMRSRVPLAGWIVAGTVTGFAVMSSLLHGMTTPDQAMPSAAESIHPKTPVASGKSLSQSGRIAARTTRAAIAPASQPSK